MKKQLYIFLNLFFVSLFIPALCSMETSSHFNEHAKTSFITSIKNLAYKTPFFACWHSNLAQKEAAQETIKNLLFEKAQLKTKLHASNFDPEEKETILQQITEINKQIHDQKVITGEKWSKKRIITLKTLCAFSGTVCTIIGLIKYKDLHQTIQILQNQSTLDHQSFTTLQNQSNKEQSTAQNKNIQQQNDIANLQQQLNIQIDMTKNTKKNLQSQIEDIKKQAERDLQQQKDRNESLIKSSTKIQQDLQKKLEKKQEELNKAHLDFITQTDKQSKEYKKKLDQVQSYFSTLVDQQSKEYERNIQILTDFCNARLRKQAQDFTKYCNACLRQQADKFISIFNYYKAQMHTNNQTNEPRKAMSIGLQNNNDIEEPIIVELPDEEPKKNNNNRFKEPIAFDLPDDEL